MSTLCPLAPPSERNSTLRRNIWEEKALQRGGVGAGGSWKIMMVIGDHDSDCVVIMIMIMIVMIKNHPRLLPSLTAKTWMVP